MPTHLQASENIQAASPVMLLLQTWACFTCSLELIFSHIFKDTVLKTLPNFTSFLRSPFRDSFLSIQQVSVKNRNRITFPTIFPLASQFSVLLSRETPHSLIHSIPFCLLSFLFNLDLVQEHFISNP